MIHKPTRRRDNDMRFPSQRNRLRNHVQPAHHNRTPQRNRRAKRLKRLSNLRGEFARRRKHEPEKRLRLLKESLQHGQRKRSRLPAARLSQSDDVPALQRDGDGFGLDGGGGLVA
ncbi:hypothetical protein CDD80_3939 [Ophiocordyceps camponoti-rufipedis]|uniref:Uncharacterized protein n=1 Tax=Ophiocordyceps camponoti-rufipedis TaxID=2004952 RepID=A0A2C5XI47_9HYPO|nr:hypothetical protein CDD80_3939 [Ophiocordyceps camponoti-rufipedis]